jgi:hypothetical protein
VPGIVTFIKKTLNCYFSELLWLCPNNLAVDICAKIKVQLAECIIGCLFLFAGARL